MFFFFWNQSVDILSSLLCWVTDLFFIEKLLISIKKTEHFSFVLQISFSVNCLLPLKKGCFLKKNFICVVKLINFVMLLSCYILKRPPHAEIYNQFPQVFFFLGTLSWPSTPKIPTRSKEDHKRAPIQRLSEPWTYRPDTQGALRAKNWKEMRSKGVGCKELPVHMQRVTEKPAAVSPWNSSGKRHRICFQPSGPQLHTSWDQACVVAPFLGEKSAAGLESITDEAHVQSYLSFKQGNIFPPTQNPVSSLPWQIAKVSAHIPTEKLPTN